MKNKSNRAVLYLNAATPQGIAWQRRTLTEFAREQGLDVIDECVDEDHAVSRPGLGAVFDAVKNTSKLIVLIDRPERLSEDLIERETIVGLIQYRGGKVVCRQPVEESSNAGDIHKAVAFAEELRTATLGGKLTAARKRKQSAGKPYGGRPAYGDKPGEQAVVKLIHDLHQEHGWKGYRIANQLNERGLRTRKGTPWTGTAVSRILNR